MSEQMFERSAMATLMDLDALERSDAGMACLREHTKEIDLALGALCDGLAESAVDDEEVTWLARRAFRVVLELANRLERIDSDDHRTRDKLELARASIAELLDTLAPMVRPADRFTREVWLGDG